jgi:two-component system, OmpR family, response regulator
VNHNASEQLAVERKPLRSILYVDDDLDICEIVRATLGLIKGLSVHCINSGESAIDVARDIKPDLILMDVMMPGLDGPSTLKRIRLHEEIAHIPIIFLTAKVLPAEIAHFEQLGAAGVIAKPFDPLTLGDELLAAWKAGGIKGARVPGESLRVRKEADSLTKSFVRRIRTDVVRIQVIVQQLCDGDQSTLKEAYRIAHSIHGSGAIFGFPDLSVSGGVIERLIDSVLRSDTGRSVVDQTEFLRKLVVCTNRLEVEVALIERAS